MTTDTQKLSRDILREIIDSKNIKRDLKSVIELYSDKISLDDLSVLKKVLKFEDNDNIKKFIRGFVNIETETLQGRLKRFSGIEKVDIGESLIVPDIPEITAEQPLSNRVKYIGAEALSEALKGVAPLVSDYAQPKTSFIQKAIKSFADNSNTNGEFLVSLALVISYMYSMCDLPTTTFAKRLRLMYYLPEMLRNVSLNEAIPEIFLDPLYSISHYSMPFIEAYTGRAEKIAKNILARANNAKVPLDIRVDLKMIPSYICESIDDSVRKNLDDDVMIYEDKDGTILVFFIPQLRKRFLAGNFKNPLTNEDFDKDFIDSFRRAYNVPLKINMASLMKDFMKIIENDIDKRVMCVENERDYKKRKECTNEIDEENEKRLSVYRPVLVRTLSSNKKDESDTESEESEESEEGEESEESSDGESVVTEVISGETLPVKEVSQQIEEKLPQIEIESPKKKQKLPQIEEESPKKKEKLPQIEAELPHMEEKCYKCKGPTTKGVALRTVILDNDDKWREIMFCSFKCFNEEKKAFARFKVSK